MKKALDVAAYLIKLSENTGEPITNMKLQKLLYYSYAWYLVEKKKKLFDDKIFAWKYGPVVLNVYERYGVYGAEPIKEAQGGDPESLDLFSKRIIEDVFAIYGGKSAIELMELSHSEAPWRDTFNPQKQNTEIPDKLIFSFYEAKKEKIANE